MRGQYTVILVFGTSHAIRAEHVLHAAGIDCKLVPVPRHLSSNCGVCVRINSDQAEKAQKELEKANLQIEGVHELE